MRFHVRLRLWLLASGLLLRHPHSVESPAFGSHHCAGMVVKGVMSVVFQPQRERAVKHDKAIAWFEWGPLDQVLW